MNAMRPDIQEACHIRHQVRQLTRSVVIAALLACAVAPRLGQCAEIYTIDQKFGDIEFSVDHLGLFTSRGGFRHWAGHLTLDQAHPEQSQVDVMIDAGSVFMPWEDATALLRSAPYFDVGDYPAIRFRTTEVKLVSPNNYLVRGLLELRGVTHPQEFTATLLGRRLDPALQAEVADFVVTGKLIRSRFGMDENRMFISDAVSIQIRAHIRLGGTLGAN